MVSTTRLFGFLFLGAIVCAISACAEPRVTVCGTTGVLCPVGFHCAAAQEICIKDEQTCGDFHTDPMTEVCDDGNNLDGDGCSRDCKSDESCGNGKVDKPVPGNPKDIRNEDCEPPGKVDMASGFFCKASCKFAFCGNGVTDGDIGEICDDGNTKGGDGCSPDCKSTELCGNGILDQPVKDANGLPDLDNPQNEVCDDGNTADGDRCSGDCRSTEACGNGKVDPGEECDDGVANNGDDKDCRLDCVINRCGDGHPNTSGVLHKEFCDAGRPVMDTMGNMIPAPTRSRAATPKEAEDCNIDCTIPTCGDSKVNHSFKPDAVHGEQCDNGAGVNADNADCTANCQVSVCGDNLQNTAGPAHAEGCDDGNRVDTDECNNACVARSCGDGIFNPNPPANEQCDNGALNSDTAACLLNCRNATCGDGHTEAGIEECDNGANNGAVGNPCSSTCRNRTCGNGIIDPGEECDNGTGVNADNADCRIDCILNRCGDGYVNSTGRNHEDCEGLSPPIPHGNTSVTPVETAGCNLNCTTATCGDGIVNRHFRPGGLTSPFEQCDDGAHANGDGCSAGCLFERCGNGIVDQGEQCDLTANTPPACSATCFHQVCGNGIVDPGEECDDPAGNGNDKDCRSDCVINRCGDGFTNLLGSLTHREVCDEATQATPGSRAVNPINTNTCNANCKAATCGDSFVNPVHRVAPPALLTEQCDPPGPGCSLTCRIQNCGNGVPDPGEQCDDGNAVNTDDCTNQCTNARCGDGFTHLTSINPLAIEECDDGNFLNTDACTNTCKHAVCGDGFIGPGEQCDDPTHATTCPWRPTNEQCDTCDPVTCQTVLGGGTRPFCGDGVPDPGFEVCDDANTSGCGSCSNTCQTFASQGSTGLIFAARTSDYRLATDTHDTFVLDDGFNDPTTFELVIGTVTAPHILVPIQAGDNNATVAARIALAINNSGLTISAVNVPLSSLVTLTNTRASMRGDETIQNNVQTTNFFTSGMGGSKGGNCSGGQNCMANIDCASNQCTFTPPAVIGQCAP